MKTLPHLGMRKLKSAIAVLIGFFLWQLVRLFFPGLELHPIYIYLYSIVEIRENKEKTITFGIKRLKANLVAFSIGLPLLLLGVWLKGLTESFAIEITVDLTVLMVGILLSISFAEWADCKPLCAIAAIVMIILYVSHAEDEPLIYTLLRSIQTVMGVGVAWLVNSVLLPYPKREKKIPENK